MALIITSPFLQLALHPDRASWDLTSSSGARLIGAQVALIYRHGPALFSALPNWQAASLEGPVRTGLLAGSDVAQQGQQVTLASTCRIII